MLVYRSIPYSHTHIACHWGLFLGSKVAGEQALHLGDLVRNHARAPRERRRSRIPARLVSLAIRNAELAGRLETTLWCGQCSKHGLSDINCYLVKKSHFIIPITYFRGFFSAMLGLFYSRKESSLRKGIKFTPATTRNLPALLVYLLSINSNLNYLRRVKNSTTVRPPLFLSTLKDKGVKYNSYLLWM